MSIKKRKKQTLIFLSLKALVFRTGDMKVKNPSALMGWWVLSLLQNNKWNIEFPGSVWILVSLSQCVPSCVCSGIVFPKCSSRLRKASKGVLPLVSSPKPRACFPSGLWLGGNEDSLLCFLGLDSFVLHLISSRSDPGLGCSYLQSLRDLEYSPVLLCKNGWIWFEREKREAVVLWGWLNLQGFLHVRY